MNNILPNELLNLIYKNNNVPELSPEEKKEDELNLDDRMYLMSKQIDTNVTNNIYSVKLTRKVQNPSMKTNEIILYFDVAYFKKTKYLSYTNLYKNNITNICTMPMHIFPFLLTCVVDNISQY